MGSRLVSDVAKVLGVSGTTLRRMEAAGAIPAPAHVADARSKEARVYAAAQVRAQVSERRSAARRNARWRPQCAAHAAEVE